MSRNRLKARLDQGEHAFGAWCVMASAFGAELLGAQGFDYVCIDCQHSLIHFDSMWPMLQALRWTQATPLARIPSNDPIAAGKALDAGAEGIIFPSVDSKEEAERAVAACRYPPEGNRSFGPVRSGLIFGMDPAKVNREILCVVMIENTKGVELADEICSTEGLDGVYVGPADLSLSMGLTPSVMQESREHSDAIEHVRKTCETHDIVAGIHTSGGQEARRFAVNGFRMCSIPTDAVLLRTSAKRELAAARGEDGDSNSLPYAE